MPLDPSSVLSDAKGLFQTLSTNPKVTNGDQATCAGFVKSLSDEASDMVAEISGSNGPKSDPAQHQADVASFCNDPGVLANASANDKTTLKNYASELANGTSGPVAFIAQGQAYLGDIETMITLLNRLKNGGTLGDALSGQCEDTANDMNQLAIWLQQKIANVNTGQYDAATAQLKTDSNNVQAIVQRLKAFVNDVTLVANVLGFVTRLATIL